MFRLPLLVVSAIAALVIAASASAALNVNSAITISRQVTVQIIQTALNNGTSPATALGDTTQRADIEASVDIIWAQAGIDISFLPTVTTYNNTFAYQGSNPAAMPRPSTDLDSIFENASTAGKLNGDLLTLNLIFVNNVPAFDPLNESQVAGYARVSGNGINAFVGDNLLVNHNNRDIVASVISHEIGHNLGLNHFSDGAFNLMAGSNGMSQQLDATQVASARGSNFARLYTPPSLTGDYNGNHVVDAADYIIWRNSNGTPANYTAWRSNFGKTGGAGTGSDGGESGAVPEPAAFACLLIAISAWLATRTKRGGENSERGHHGGISTT